MALDRVAASVRRLSAAGRHMRQGERSGRCRITFIGQDVDLSARHDVHGFGILYSSVICGVMNANVSARTDSSDLTGTSITLRARF
jgi:hypothetical protein